MEKRNNLNSSDKELLLKDLSARLPYGVKCEITGLGSRTVCGIRKYKDTYDVHIGYDICGNSLNFDIEKIKPYLRPLSSMTSAEKSELELLGFRYDSDCTDIINEDVNEYDDYRQHPYTAVDEIRCSEVMDFLRSHHFDHLDLIPKGFALYKEGMYD